MNFGNNLTKAREQAQANADTFGIPYYVVTTSMGLAVEREAPRDTSRIIVTALPRRTHA